MNTATKTEQQLIDIYCQAKAGGASQMKAVYAVMNAGASYEKAADIAWTVERGHSAPSQNYGLYADGRAESRAEAEMLAKHEAI